MEYFQHNFYVTTAGVARESALKIMIEEMSESRVMFSADYPYESAEDQADWFDGLQINENTRKAVACGNAKRLFKWPRPIDRDMEAGIVGKGPEEGFFHQGKLFEWR
jgi:predicted TIM-barrel fold metal-dependent hydrolase